MKITRHGEPCPLCRTPLLLDVLQVRSAQVDLPTVERVTKHQCPGYQTVRLDEWAEAMQSHCGEI